MRACDVDLAALKKSLVHYVDTELNSWSSTTARTPSPRPASSG
jgi:hypothetical protein